MIYPEKYSALISALSKGTRCWWSFQHSLHAGISNEDLVAMYEQLNNKYPSSLFRYKTTHDSISQKLIGPAAEEDTPSTHLEASSSVQLLGPTYILRLGFLQCLRVHSTDESEARRLPLTNSGAVPSSTHLTCAVRTLSSGWSPAKELNRLPIALAPVPPP